jgi:CRP/FNR family transcriptional regulator, cyclic AMP receptor protein
MTLDRALKKHRFLAGIPEQHLAKLASLAHQVEFDEDQLILLNGQRSTQFYLLLSGSVSVEAHTAVYNISIQVLEPGDAFGWSSFLNHHDTLFQVRAREASSGFCFEGSELAAACHENPGFGLELYSRLLELVAGRVKATESRLAEFCGSTITRSVMGAHANRLHRRGRDAENSRR